MTWFYNLAKTLLIIGLKVCYNIRYEGVENIPAKGGYILVCNHRSMADPIIMAWKIRPMIHFMGKTELFKGKFLTWLFHLLGGFSVDRGSGDTGAIDEAVGFIRSGEPIGIYPEGTRSRDGKLLKPKSGVALIARMTQADILPCAIEYEGRLSFRKKIVFRYGELIPYEELGFEGDSTRGLRKATKRYWGEVMKLLGVEDEAGD